MSPAYGEDYIVDPPEDTPVYLYKVRVREVGGKEAIASVYAKSQGEAYKKILVQTARPGNLLPFTLLSFEEWL